MNGPNGRVCGSCRDHGSGWASRRDQAGRTRKGDAIKSSNAPAYLMSENVVGAIPPPDYNGIAVQGSYGKAWVIETNVIPQGYVAVVASGGPNSNKNPVAFKVVARFENPCRAPSHGQRWRARRLRRW